MTQTSLLDSPSITNLDAIPVIPNSSGQGGAGYMMTVNDYVTSLSADSTSSVYKIVRIPTQACVKSVILNSKVASAGAADINVAFSDSTVDGTSVTNQGTIPQVSSANNKLFGAAQSLVAQTNTNVTFSNSFTQANSNQPLWAVLGYTTDPGGFFDIQLNVTTQITTGGVIGLKVDYVMGAG